MDIDRVSLAVFALPLYRRMLGAVWRNHVDPKHYNLARKSLESMSLILMIDAGFSVEQIEQVTDRVGVRIQIFALIKAGFLTSADFRMQGKAKWLHLQLTPKGRAVIDELHNRIQEEINSLPAPILAR